MVGLKCVYIISLICFHYFEASNQDGLFHHMMSYALLYFVFLISVHSSGEGAEGMLFSNGNGDISMWCRQTSCFSNSELRLFYSKLSYLCNHLVANDNVRRNFSCWCSGLHHTVAFLTSGLSCPLEDSQQCISVLLGGIMVILELFM